MLSRRDMRGISRCCSSSNRPANYSITYSLLYSENVFDQKTIQFTNLVHSKARTNARKKDDKIKSCLYDKFSSPNFD